MHKIPTEHYGDCSNIFVTKGDALGVILVKENGLQATTLPMLDISSSESELREGRFWNFDPSVRKNAITINLGKGYKLIDKAFRFGIAQIVEWIAENCLDKWSFHMSLLMPDDVTLTMFFNSVEDAVLFRLSLQRE